MNIPNRLTILRVAMIPLFVVAMLWQSLPYSDFIAGGLFILACITDYFDGYLARKYNQVTVFGKFMDPLADKLLVCSALICFLAEEDAQMPVWAVIIIIGREFIISGFRCVAAERGVTIAASWWGKIKTFVQMAMAILLIFDFQHPFFRIVNMVCIYAAVVLTVVSLADYIYKNRDVMRNQEKELLLVNKLTKKGYTITTAESCTGGLLSGTLVNVSGASNVLCCSFVTYANEAKEKLLSVRHDTLESFGAVSPETAKEMALGAADSGKADMGLSTTGVAGPGGGTAEKPVGLVYIGCALHGEVVTERHLFSGDRAEVRRQAVEAAMDLAIRCLDKE